MLALPLAIVAPLVAGYVLSGLLRAGPGTVLPSRLLRASLAVGWALGTSSCAFFAWLVVVGKPRRAFFGADLALFAGLAAFGAVAARAGRGPGDDDDRAGRLPRPIGAALRVALGASLAAWVALFAVVSRQAPHGRWDAMSIWNLRARFLYRGGDAWAEAFHPSLIASHLDYPLLVPLSVARCWAYLGRETTAAPAQVAFAFTLATVGLLVSALVALRGRDQGALGGLVLLSASPLFVTGSMQFADVPLAYFILAATVALSIGDRAPHDLPRWAATGGMMAGFAAWTKNEGLLFLAALLAARLGAAARSRRWRAYRAEAAAFALGLAPVLAVLVYFKVRFTPTNDFLAAQGPAAIVAKLADRSRYLMVAEAIAREVADLGSGAVVWLAAARLLLGGAPRCPGIPRGGFAALVLAIMLAEYVAVYVATPLPLPWHLRWSLSRLILHLWPLAIFSFFLNVATPEEALGSP